MLFNNFKFSCPAHYVNIVLIFNVKMISELLHNYVVYYETALRCQEYPDPAARDS